MQLGDPIPLSPTNQPLGFLPNHTLKWSFYEEAQRLNQNWSKFIPPEHFNSFYLLQIIKPQSSSHFLGLISKDSMMLKIRLCIQLGFVLFWKEVKFFSLKWLLKIFLLFKNTFFWISLEVELFSRSWHWDLLFSLQTPKSLCSWMPISESLSPLDCIWHSRSKKSRLILGFLKIPHIYPAFPLVLSL